MQCMLVGVGKPNGRTAFACSPAVNQRSIVEG